MDARIRHMRYYRGILLPFISESLFETKEKEVVDMLHRAFKRRFSIETTSSLTHMEIVAYTRDIRTAMSVEWGVLCPAPNDPTNLGEMDMADFIKLTLEWKDNRQT